MVFDFDRPLSLVQNVLSSLSYSLTKLSDEEKYTELNKRLAEALRELPKSYDLRKVFLFLLLNSDADVIDLVAEDERFCHLTHNVQPINFVLALQLVFKLGGSQFLFELISYGPFDLSLSVINTILSQDELSPKRLSDEKLILNLSKACFHRITLNAGDVVKLEKCFDLLVLLQNYDYSSLPNDSPFPQMNEDLKKGLHYIHNLELFEFTFEKERTSDQVQCWEGYLINCAPNNESTELASVEKRSADELTWTFRNIIMSNLNKLTRELTVDNWMGMAEITYEADKTLQRTVGEKTAHFIELLEKVSNDPRLLDLPSYLEAATPFAIKAEVEVETTMEDLSVEEIKCKFSCPTSRSSDKMKVLLKSKGVFQDVEKMRIIQDNCDLLEGSDVEFILCYTVGILEGNIVESSEEDMLKSLSYECMKYLTLENILKVKQNFLSINSGLPGFQINPNLQSTLKQLSFEPEDISEKWQCEFIRLFILNPTLVTTAALKIGVGNASLQRKITTILSILKPESQTITHDWISNVTDGCQLTRSEMDAFPKFALELWRKNVLCQKDFFRKQVISGLCKAMLAYDWNLISMWITSLQYLLEEIVSTSGEVGSVAVLLVYIGQVLEYCQQSIEEFSWACISVRVQALKVIQCLKCFQLVKEEKGWFQCYIRKYSAATLCQLEVFSSDEPPAKASVNYEHCFNGQVKTSEFAAYILAEMLSFLSLEEWCSLAEALKKVFAGHKDSAYSVFQSFQKSIVLLIAACSNVDLNGDSHHRSCLDFCVRCLGTVLKTKVLPDLKPTNYLGVLEETLHLLCKLPCKVWNESGMHILPVIVDIMNKVPPQVEALNTLTAIIMQCPVNQSRELLEDKLKEVFRDSISEVSEVEMNDR